MQVVSSARRLSRVLNFSPIFIQFDRFLVSDFLINESSCASSQWRTYSDVYCRTTRVSGIAQQFCSPMPQDNPLYFSVPRVSFSSVANTAEGTPTEAVKELYDKMLESVVVKRSMPPNAWLWSLIANCKNQDDIKLLFDILQNLRRFRLSNLRIAVNFNDNLCREVTKACARVGTLDFGKKALWKHNVYGLTPSIASAHHLLSYAKDQNDSKLMVEIMKLIKKNDLPLQPGTADIIFRICYNTNSWQLISKYSRRFIRAGVKLRQTSFDTLMEFASKIGDVQSLWRFEKLRSESMKQHTLASGFSCAKGFLLERKPEEAAAIIQAFNQILPDANKSGFMTEIEKLVNEWPLDVIKHQKEEDRKELAAAFKSDIPTMVNNLLNIGLEVSTTNFFTDVVMPRFRDLRPAKDRKINLANNSALPFVQLPL